jgi:hypothetical protein
VLGPAPHAVPSVTLPASTQDAMPVEHEYTPFLQGAPGLVVQDPPEVQLQLPLPLQAFCPEVPVQAVPAAALPVMVVHADVPVEQEVFAV